MTDALTRLTIAEALEGLAARRFSARELTQAHLDAMAAAKALNAFITETPEQALAMADAADARRSRQQALPLDGVPVAVMSCMDHAGDTAAILRRWRSGMRRYDH